MGMDSTVQHNGNDSGFIKSKNANLKSFGTMMQVYAAQQYRGKRVRMSAFVKTDNVIKGSALWMRVDSPNYHNASYGSMEKRSIWGTRDWKEYEVVLDVPDDCELITLALVLSGTGQVWINNIKLQEVR
jgi:hypothetical protein